MNWWLMLLAFLLGAVLTAFYMVRSTTRQVPRTSTVAAGATAAGAAAAGGTVADTGPPATKEAPTPVKKDASTPARKDAPPAKRARPAPARQDQPTELYDQETDVDEPAADESEADESEADDATTKRSDVPREGSGAGTAAAGAAGAAGLVGAGAMAARGGDDDRGASSPEEGADKPAGGPVEKAAEKPARTAAPGAADRADTADRTDTAKGGAAGAAAGGAASASPEEDQGRSATDAQPFGPGSARPAADGSGPTGYSIKGNEDSMLYHTEESRAYRATKPEVWFKDEESAQRAGFTRWDRRPGAATSAPATPAAEATDTTDATDKGPVDKGIATTPSATGTSNRAERPETAGDSAAPGEAPRKPTTGVSDREGAALAGGAAGIAGAGAATAAGPAGTRDSAQSPGGGQQQDVAPSQETGPPSDRRASDASGEDQPFGPGSARPAADGSGPSGFTVKGNEDSMLYHTADSPAYKKTRAEVWFRDENAARAAGFKHWDRTKR